jgi:hypothetical protein
MPSVRIGIDGGDVIEVAGVIYHKAVGQPSSGAITAVPNRAGIDSYTYRRDNNNVPYGYTTWSDCEVGISWYGTGNQGFVTIAALLTYYPIFTTPSAGVVRVWADWTTVAMKVNGILLINYTDLSGGRAWGLAATLAAGSAVSVAASNNLGVTIELDFLPNVYP